MTEKVYYTIRRKATKVFVTPRGVQSFAPHLYDTYGKAEGRRKGLWLNEGFEVVKVIVSVAEEDQ